MRVCSAATVVLEVSGLAEILDTPETLQADRQPGNLEDMMQRQAFRPAKVLVTGGAGFIGSHVVRRLVEAFGDVETGDVADDQDGHVASAGPEDLFELVVLDKLSYCASMKNLEDVLDAGRGKVKFVRGDITSSDLVSYVLENEGIDTVLHFAAETHVDNSFGNSFAFTQTNVLGTHVLLECCKRLGSQIKRFIHVSTDEVYGESTGLHSFEEEESVLEPTNPYAATKAAAEFLVKAYHRSFNLPTIITRGNNVYGPGQYPEKIVPKFIHQMMRGLPLTVHGDGSTRRNMLFVSDVADAFVCILRHASPGETINIGGDFEHTVSEIADEVLRLFDRLGQREDFVEYVEDRKFNDTRYNISNTKLLELGWKQQVSFNEGMRRTLAWYRDHPDHWGSVEHALRAHPRFFGDQATHEVPPRRA